MDKQEKRIIIRIDDETKKEFTKICDDNHMTLSARIKYLLKMDINGRLKINENGK